MLTAEIISIGSELLSPHFADTNSLYLTEQLNRIGIAVVMRTVVGDHEQYLAHAIDAATARTALVITIGGLGPTGDDITRKVVAERMHLQLVLDDAVLARIQQRYATRGREMPANNARQALVPVGAQILENTHGTAPGLWIERERKTILLLPGPPRELKPMFERSCYPRLIQMAGPLALAHRIYRTTGLPESALDARIAPIYRRYRNPETTVLSKPGQVDVHLVARAKTEEDAEALLDEVGTQIDREIADYIFARTEQELEEVVGMYLVMKDATIGVAESCTGGLLAERLTRVPGSSRYFESGLIVYSNTAKMDLAGIPPLLLEMEGAVSKSVAIGLAESVRERLGTTLGVGVTGIAGPTGGSAEKPVGTVHIAVAGPLGTEHGQFVFPGGRNPVRWQSAQAALDSTRRYLSRL